MKKLLIVLNVAILLLIWPSSVFAATTCGGIDTAVLNCGNSGDPITSLLIVAVNFLAVAVGVAVLIGIVFGAFLYTSAAGSAEQAKRGIGYIRNAIIALVLFVFMYAIINYMVPGGLF